MSRYVNPFTDIGFKIIFGQPASKELLIILLNELLAGEHHIEDLVFLDKEDRADNIHDKGIIYDLYCRTDSGEFIIVEMQNRWHSHFLDRTLYYVCRAVSRQIENPLPKHIPIPENRDENGMLVKEEFVPYGKRYQLSTVYGVVPLYPYLSLLDNRKTPAEIGSCILHRERIEIMLERLPITPHLITIDKPMMETYSHRHRTASLHIDHYLSEYRQRDILACILRKLEL